MAQTVKAQAQRLVKGGLEGGGERSSWSQYRECKSVGQMLLCDSGGCLLEAASFNHKRVNTGVKL